LFKTCCLRFREKHRWRILEYRVQRRTFAPLTEGEMDKEEKCRIRIFFSTIITETKQGKIQQSYTTFW
jgi:hypothetical protein